LKGPNTVFWTVTKDGSPIGKVTSAVHSPRLRQNIALAMITAEHAVVGEKVEVGLGNRLARSEIVERPFFDPRKSLATEAARVA
jgi:aminomethyltransferase